MHKCLIWWVVFIMVVINLNRCVGKDVGSQNGNGGKRSDVRQGFQAIERRKRAAGELTRAFRTILTGATYWKRDKLSGTKFYFKTGGYQRALLDFKVLKLDHIHIEAGTRIGITGDRMVIFGRLDSQYCSLGICNRFDNVRSPILKTHLQTMILYRINH